MHYNISLVSVLTSKARSVDEAGRPPRNHGRLLPVAQRLLAEMSAGARNVSALPAGSATASVHSKGSSC